MGLFSRNKKEADAEPTTAASEWEPSADGADVVDDGRPQRPASEPIGPEQQQRIDAALARFAEVGGDVDDLASIADHFDRAVAGDGAGLAGDETVEVIGLVIGEHLVRHGRMDWRIISDAFGTDLGVSARRRELSVIPPTIVATRWINREAGWIPGVVGHLARLGNG